MLSHKDNKPVIPVEGESSLALKRLIDAAKKGDSASFEAIYAKIYSPLYRYIYSRTRNKEETEDIVQQVFLRFYEALPRYEYLGEEGTLLAYLFTIGKRLIWNESSKKKPIFLDDDSFELIEDESTNLFLEADIKLLAEKINDLLPNLTDDEEDVIRLFFYAELSHKEISQILNKEEAHVRKIKERALRKLRTLAKHLDE